MIKKHKGNPAWKKGMKKLGGRKPGSHNKFTTLKDAFINAFNRLGGEDALLAWANPDPIKVMNKRGKMVTIDISSERKKELFKMLSVMLPKDVQMNIIPGNILDKYKDMPVEELKEKASGIIAGKKKVLPI